MEAKGKGWKGGGRNLEFHHLRLSNLTTAPIFLSILSVCLSVCLSAVMSCWPSSVHGDVRSPYVNDSISNHVTMFTATYNYIKKQAELTRIIVLGQRQLTDYTAMTLSTLYPWTVENTTAYDG